MAEITATEASRRFADMLDAVEHRGESFIAIAAASLSKACSSTWRCSRLTRPWLAATPTSWPTFAGSAGREEHTIFRSPRSPAQPIAS